MKHLALLAAICAISAAAPVAATTVLDFETAAMPNAGPAPVPVASQLANQYKATLGVSFSSGAGYAAVVCHCGNTKSGQNVIGGTNAGGLLDYSQPISAGFYNTANLAQLATTDFVKIWLDFIPLGSGTVTLQAFDALGAQIGSISTIDNGAVQSLSLGMAGIQSVKFFSDNQTVAFDDFEFGDLTPVANVPEPSSWAMIVGGLGLAGLALRRRNAAISFA